MDWPLSCPRTSRELSPPGGESSHQSRGGGDSSTEEEEESDDDSSSSSSAKKTMAEVDEALSKFRLQWKEELISKEQCEKREKAVSLYTKGILLENSGHIGDAVSCYQRANHLLPEIDVMFHTAFRAQRNTQGSTPSSRTSRASSPTVGQEDYGSDNKMSPNCGDENVDLYKLFSKALILGRGSWCDRNQEQQATHISSLPPEIVLLIMRWIVGKDLDLRSMEILSQVCRGFYLLVRDDGIWRDACLQVHGAHILQKKNLGSLTYRDVWVSQPRPNFNGVYISRTSYVRMGENSFQDTSSRPWHLVEYFRYIRFFPEGYCLTCTTPDPPKQTIPHLRDRDCKIPQVMIGRWMLTPPVTLHCVFAPRQSLPQSVAAVSSNVKRRGIGTPTANVSKKTFFMELSVASHGKKRIRPNSCLNWIRYEVQVVRWDGLSSRTNFDLTPSHFAPFWFSRVKSYSLHSDEPLTEMTSNALTGSA